VRVCVSQVLDFVDRNSEGIHKTYANLRALLEGSSLSLMARALDLPETRKLGDRNMGERVVAQVGVCRGLSGFIGPPQASWSLLASSSWHSQSVA
jgi:hypothetical protein